MQINKNYLNIKDSYLFSTIAKKINEFKAANPDKDIIKLSIGDVTLPLPKASIDAMQKAVAEMGVKETFRGYGEEQGYLFLREAVSNYYSKKGVSFDTDEIFISDGAKSDVGNILDIFDKDNTVVIPDPVYPVYVDTNIMLGRSIIFAQGNEDNSFLPTPDYNVDADIIYMCSPNNPTGAVYSRDQLKEWVDYANSKKAVILFDAAYEAFIQDKNLPTSIFEIDGAKTCAIEFSSLSKTAGFTGTRCGYTVVPKDLEFEGVKLNRLWLRRQSTKFNGVPYIVQRGAEGVFTDQGYKETRANIAYYLDNAKIIRSALDELGIWYVGGQNSPYIWMKCPNNMKSWDFFDLLLTKAYVAGTPGSGFGEMGEGFFRINAFGEQKNVEEAMRRIKEIL